MKICEGTIPNGKPGGNPYTDIVIHGRDVYSAEGDELTRELDSLGAAIGVHDVLTEHEPDPDEDALAADLRALKRTYESED
jgi:hypothetical protein